MGRNFLAEKEDDPAEEGKDSPKNLGKNVFLRIASGIRH